MTDDDIIGRIVSDKELQTLERAVLSAVKDTRRNLDRYRMLVFWDNDPKRVSHIASFDPPIVQLLLKMRDKYNKLETNEGIPEGEREQKQMDLLTRMQTCLERFGKITLETARVAESVLMKIAGLTQRQREHKDKVALQWALLDSKGVTPLGEQELEKIAAGQPLTDADPIVIDETPKPLQRPPKPNPAKSGRYLEAL